MVTELIPGEPRDLSSFFQPLLQDLALLAHGIDAIDGSLISRPHFKLKAHLCAITGDFPAISKMMEMKGANGHAPCRFCAITGVFHESSRHTYYPLGGQRFCRSSHIHSEDTICLRTNLRDEILLVNVARDADKNRLHGITGQSTFLQVPTIHFPLSWGLDGMHLFSNVAKLFWSIWGGKVLPLSFEDASAKSYVLSEAQILAIGQVMEVVGSNIPVSVSRLPRSIHKHVNSFKATKWYSWILLFSVPLLCNKLPDYALQHWILFTEAIRLCLQVQLSSHEINLIESKLRAFVEMAESIYYQGLAHRLPVCTSQLHSLLHVATNLRSLGPSYVSWQFGLEQYIGRLAPLATSKSQINASIYNGLEWLENLQYLRPMYKLQSNGKKESFCIDLLNDNRDKYGALLGRGKKTMMTKRLNRTLNSWYAANSGGDPSNCNASMECMQWSKVQRLVTIGTAQDFIIATRTTGSHKVRAHNYVSFLEDGGLGYGQVISFLRHQSPLLDTEMTWALLDYFVVICDTLTNMLYFERTENKAGSRPLDIHDIVAPIGILRRTHAAGWWILEGYRIDVAMAYA